MYFSANDGINGSELWKTDGTAAGTAMVKNIAAGSAGSNPNNLANVNGTLYFVADDLTNGPELWKSDGTATGTVLVKDIYVGWPGSQSQCLTNVNGILLFTSYGGGGQAKLWRSDGTAAGTELLSDVPLGSSGYSEKLININGLVFFPSYDDTNGQELWKSDGTPAGTTLVKDILPGSNSGNPFNLTNVNGTLFFNAYFGTMIGRELWKSDGTEAGTILVKDIYPGRGHSNADNFTDVNGTTFFTAYDPVSLNALWKSDGTEAGTILVKDIITSGGELDGKPYNLTSANGLLFFTIDDGINGTELWKSDGTAAGTILVKDIFAGISASNPSALTAVGNFLYFQADDGISGKAIWRTDGTESGTVLVQDSAPDATTIVMAGSKIYTVITTADKGQELWVANALTVLPAHLLAFTGNIKNGEGILQWKTENEINADKYIIERSTDGRNFIAIGHTNAKNTAGTNLYEYKDPQIKSLPAPVFYYRLKQTDTDGRFTYSGIVALTPKNKHVALLYPNPLKETLNMAVTVAAGETISIRVLDNAGKMLRQETRTLTVGTTLISLNVNSLPAGKYYIHVTGATLKETLNIIKQ